MEAFIVCSCGKCFLFRTQMLRRNIWSSSDVPGLLCCSHYQVELLDDTEKSVYSNSYIETFCCCITFLKCKASHIHS